MPVDKLYNSAKEALSCISDGDVVGVSGFEGLGAVSYTHLTLPTKA